MTKSQYLKFYNDFGKFKELHVEDLFCKNESEVANGNLPFFVYYFSSNGITSAIMTGN